MKKAVKKNDLDPSTKCLNNDCGTNEMESIQLPAIKPKENMFELSKQLQDKIAEK